MSFDLLPELVVHTPTAEDIQQASEWRHVRLLCEAQCLPDRFRQERPSLLLFFELPPSGRRNRVEAGFSASVGCAPLGPKPPVTGHALQGGVQRTFFDPQGIISDLMDPLCNRITMLRPTPGQRVENQQID